MSEVLVLGMLPFSQTKTSLVVGEAFKRFGEKIKMIHAVMRAPSVPGRI